VRRAAIAAALACVLPLSAAQGPEGTAVVRGRVVDGDTGKPLRNLSVRFYPQNRYPHAPGIDPEPPMRSAITGADGGFEVPRLVAADYSVSTSARGYLSTEYGVSRPGGPSRLLTVRESARLDITLRAWRSASIAGRVYDERGRPVMGAEVRAFEKDSEGYGSSGTNDLGEYEIAGLRPGNYAVAVPISLSSRTLSATPGRQGPHSPPLTPYVLDRAARTILMPRGAPLPASADDGRPQVYVTAFSGGVSTKAGALYIPLRSGDARGDIDITLPAVRGTRVAGTVTGPDDIRGTLLRLRPEAASRSYDVEWIDATAATDGRFVFVAAPPGRYILTAYRHRPPLTEITLESGGPSFPHDDVIIRDEDDYWAEMPLAIGDSDLEDLVITLRPGTPLTGRVVFEDDGGAPARADQARILLAPPGPRFSDGDRYARIARDGSVAMRVRPGTYRVISGSNLQGRVLKATLVNGRDIGDEPLVIGADPIDDVQFVFGRHAATLAGAVFDRAGNPAADAAVVLFPANRAQWFRLDESGRGRFVRAANGSYLFSGVAPGEYYVAALEGFRGGISAESAALFAGSASRITVRPGEPARTNLVLRVPE
jgi:protocatechuate 3,4-dioxygenase beta subunit